MLKEALSYLVSLGKAVPVTEYVGDNIYVLDKDGRILHSLDQEDALNEQNAERNALDHAHDMELKRLEHAYELTHRSPASIKTSTLTSIAQYIRSNPEGFLHEAHTKPIIHIESATSVRLITAMDYKGGRNLVIEAKAITPSIAFEKKMPVEQLIIALQTQFARDGDRDALLRLVSNITDQESLNIKDNGISQTVTVKKGAVDIGEEKIPNPVMLAPFRTFIDAEQPRSYYIFRVFDGCQVALFEVGGNEWQIAAMNNIKAFFEEALEGLNIDIIL